MNPWSVSASLTVYMVTSVERLQPDEMPALHTAAGNSRISVPDYSRKTQNLGVTHQLAQYCHTTSCCVNPSTASVML